MPKVTEQYRTERREQILRAARQCFLRDGFHATSMQDLFAEAGLSSGAVYRYFASKDDMILAIAEDNMREVVAMIHTAATERRESSVGDVLADVIEIVRAKHEHDGIAGLALQVWAEASRNPSLGARFNVLLTGARAELREIIRSHQVAGDLPAQVSAESIAAVLLAIVPGFILQLALFGDTTEGFPDAVRAIWPTNAAPSD